MEIGIVALIAVTLAVGVGLAIFVFFVSQAYDRAALKGKRLANVSDEAILERRKTLLEISDLRFGWLRTLSTALLTVAVAIGGWYYPTFVSIAQQRQQRQEFLDEQLYENLSNLVDNNAGKRLAAIVYLRDRYQDLPVGSPERGQIIAAFVHQLSIETDPIVDDELEEISQEMDADTLPDLVSANRRQLFTISRQLGEVVAELLAKSSFTDVNAALSAIGHIDMRSATYQPQRPIYLAYTLPLLRSLNAYCPFAVAIGSGRAGILTTTELANETEVLNREGISASDVYLSTIFQALVSVAEKKRYGTSVPGTAPTLVPRARGYVIASLAPVTESTTTVEQLKQGCAILVATGSFITNVLRKAPPGAVDLQSTAIPSVDVSNANLSGANLSRSIILADLAGSDLSLADLSDANLSYIVLGKAPIQFSAVNLKGAALPPYRKFNFVGTNFWQAYSLNWIFGNDAELYADKNAKKAAWAKCREIAVARKGTCPWSP